MKFTGSALAITVAIIVALWLAGQALGFHVSLWHSLALSIGLTILVNVVLTMLSRRNR